MSVGTGREWVQVKPETEGYSAARLNILREWLATGDTSAMMVVAHGRVIFTFGDVAHVSKVASIRKSILSLLYGKYVTSHVIDLAATVPRLGLQEPHEEFLPIERSATLGELLSGRSGIYILPSTGSAADDAIQSAQPRRGSMYPGSYFHYNDWDFDAAGTAFERLTGRNIYDALQTDLALPLGMQDFERKRQQKIDDPSKSIHPEYAMYLSTRDLARVGLMVLQFGQWQGKEIVPGWWISQSTSAITPFEEMNPPFLRALGNPDRWGFGFMWWVWDAPTAPSSPYFAPFQAAIEARGTGGQYLTILPARDLVIVHKVDIDQYPHKDVSQAQWDAILGMVLASKCSGEPC